MDVISGYPAETAFGYASQAYAEALSEFGEPLMLPQSGGWLLQRRIPGSLKMDALVCDPVVCCRDWNSLGEVLGQIGRGLISVVLVTDPFGDTSASVLETIFPDRMRPFKAHFVINLGRPMESFVDGHHVRNVRYAEKKVAVELCDNPLLALSDWTGIYANLIERHAIRGIATFSEASFAKQFAVPGMVAMRAVRGGRTVGMLLWYRQGTCAYYHLGSYSEEGYRSKASFALFAFAIRHFADQGVGTLLLGAGAGATGDATDGLTRFKAGWSTGTRMTYLCGRIFDAAAYDTLSHRVGTAGSSYFPTYRAGEFS